MISQVAWTRQKWGCKKFHVSTSTVTYLSLDSRFYQRTQKVSSSNSKSKLRWNERNFTFTQSFVFEFTSINTSTTPHRNWNLLIGCLQSALQMNWYFANFAIFTFETLPVYCKQNFHDNKIPVFNSPLRYTNSTKNCFPSTLVFIAKNKVLNVWRWEFDKRREKDERSFVIFDDSFLCLHFLYQNRSGMSSKQREFGMNSCSKLESRERNCFKLCLASERMNLKVLIECQF